MSQKWICTRCGKLLLQQVEFSLNLLPVAVHVLRVLIRNTNGKLKRINSNDSNDVALFMQRV